MDVLINSVMVGIESSFLTQVSKIVSVALSPEVLIILGLVISGFLYYKYSRREGFVFGLIVIVAGVLIKGLKFLVGRVRPGNGLISESGFSMPSGHATIAVVFFGYLGYLLFRGKSLRVRVFGWIGVGLVCVFVAFTRVYLRVHWFSDVVVGLGLGLVILGLGFGLGRGNRDFGTWI